jgi:outer membrane protein OmpA-like peptidoglycan-associated protein
MRNLRRSNREEEEEESVFVPMTDMTVSFLFIVMILLAFFAVRFSDKDTVPQSVYENLKQKFNLMVIEKDRLIDEVKTLKAKVTELEKLISEKDEVIKKLQIRLEELIKRLNARSPLELYISSAQSQRAEILKNIEEALKREFKNDVLVEISPENDALRFKGEGLFASNESTLLPGKRKVIDRLAQLISGAISSYTINNQNINYVESNPYGIVIEAVQVEGHTDSNGSDEINLRLSTERANNAFLAMLSSQKDLLSFLNIRGQPVMSVAGYGKMRPIAPNDNLRGQAENRRIDLRLIMYTPRNSEQVERIQQQIKSGLRLSIEDLKRSEAP